MSPAEIIRRIDADLRDYAESRGGEVSIAGDAYHVLELLQDKPRGWRAIIHWAGDRAPVGGVDAGMVEHELHLVVGLHVGLALRPGQHAVVDRSGDEPALDRFFAVRDRARALRFGDARRSVADCLLYVRSEPLVTPEGVPMAAYRAIFNIRASL